MGILVGAYPCGIITLFDELYGSESLSQVHGIIIEYLDCLEEGVRKKLVEIIYDDACHLKKFSEDSKRAKYNDVTKFMATLGKHVDKGLMLNFVMPQIDLNEHMTEAKISPNITMKILNSIVT